MRLFEGVKIWYWMGGRVKIRFFLYLFVFAVGHGVNGCAGWRRGFSGCSIVRIVAFVRIGRKFSTRVLD